MSEKPFAPACERNKDPIWSELKKHLRPEDSVLEIGAGTGQHAVYFTEKDPSLRWQCSDLKENLSGIRSWLNDTENDFVEPLEFDMAKVSSWPEAKYNVLFTANTFHIASLQSVITFCENCEKLILENGFLAIYGPFLYEHKETSPSNIEFDQWLKNRDQLSGIRSFSTIANALTNRGFVLENDIEMPANNRLLIFKKGTS